MNAPYDNDIIKLNYYLDFDIQEELEITPGLPRQYVEDLKYEQIKNIRK